MRKWLFGGLLAVLAAGVAAAVLQQASRRSVPAGGPPLRDVGQMIAALKTASAGECAHYQEQLVACGMKVLPRLKQTAAACDDARYKQRLLAVIVRLSQPTWRSSLATALEDAKQSDQMVMLFSTVGGVNGYS